MKTLYQWKSVELMLGWPMPVQPNEEVFIRYWGLAIEAVFFGFVTLFRREETAA